jgi:hypothetical protein
MYYGNTCIMHPLIHREGGVTMCGYSSSGAALGISVYCDFLQLYHLVSHAFCIFPHQNRAPAPPIQFLSNIAITGSRGVIT